MTRASTKVSRIIGAPRRAVYEACLATPPGGKTSEDTDTFQGRFVELVADERIVEAIEFDARDPAFADEIFMTTLLADADGGTEVTMLCQALPPGKSASPTRSGHPAWPRSTSWLPFLRRARVVDGQGLRCAS